MTKIMITARVDNYYPATGDTIVTEPTAELPVPPGPVYGVTALTVAVQDWVDEHLFGMTGTGRTKGDATYDLIVIKSSRPDLVPVGYRYEWGY